MVVEGEDREPWVLDAALCLGNYETTQLKKLLIKKLKRKEKRHD